MFIEVIKPGPLSSIQDGGRLGYLHTGLAPAGPMDHLSLRIASLLVGNEIPPPLFCGGSRGDAGFEFTLLGPTIKFHADTIIALAGAEMPASLDGTEVPYYESVPISAGNTLSLGAARRGARTYLAVAGGLDVTPVLGSRSENLFSSRGPFGRALKRDDSIPIRDLSELDERRSHIRFDRSRLTKFGGERVLRVVMGPQHEVFTEKSLTDFTNETWKLSTQANRTGLRFHGPKLEFGPRPTYLVRDAGADPSNIVDDIIPVGGIQCPSGIEAIVMGTENPTVGGFAKIATVISTDIATAGQMQPGDIARFKPVSVDKALELAEAAAALVGTHNIISG
ncbi:MAG TPA: allophanate hydrolase [Gammaproteobacteria bacterium]|nr:allophanate hydrolase [Gammaproteobacteria bacterium]